MSDRNDNRPPAQQGDLNTHDLAGTVLDPVAGGPGSNDAQGCEIVPPSICRGRPA
jgi:hypothetical protein